MSKTKEKETERLERNLVTAAKVVDLYGTKFLPIFKRVDSELEKAKGTEDLIAKARKLAA